MSQLIVVGHGWDKHPSSKNPRKFQGLGAPWATPVIFVRDNGSLFYTGLKKT